MEGKRCVRDGPTRKRGRRTVKADKGMEGWVTPSATHIRFTDGRLDTYDAGVTETNHRVLVHSHSRRQVPKSRCANESPAQFALLRWKPLNLDLYANSERQSRLIPKPHFSYRDGALAYRSTCFSSSPCLSCFIMETSTPDSDRDGQD